MALRSYLVQIGWDRNLVIEIVTKLYCESSNKRLSCFNSNDDFEFKKQNIKLNIDCYIIISGQPLLF